MTALFDPSSAPVSSFVGDQVAHIGPDTTLVEVAKAMTDLNVSALGVESNGELLGIISERDVVRSVAAGSDVATVSALEAAVTKLIWADPDAMVAEVANEMMTEWVRHVLVGEPGQLLGIVSVRDLLGAYASSSDLEVDID